MTRCYLIFSLIILWIFLLSPASATVRRVPVDYPVIQAAIDASNEYDTVLVSPGTYYENINFHGKNIVVGSLFLVTGDPSAIISTIIDGSHPIHPDTASAVLIVSHEDTSAVLVGFTITGGNGTVWRDTHNFNLYREGGGILTDSSSPVIRDNIIRNNRASDLTGVTSAGGGGIRCGDSNPMIIRNIVIDNDGRYGGGIVLNYCGAVLRNNIVARNTGGQDYAGSGIWINGNGSSKKVIENTVVVGNSSVLDGGGVHIESATAVIRNSVIWDNSAPASPQIGLSGGTVNVSWSDVQGGWVGATNFDADPKFLVTGFTLDAGSPCIDRGDPSAGFNDQEDPGNIGSAKQPSLGSVRNDCGAYGGPDAAPMVPVGSRLNHPLPPTGLRGSSDFSTPTSVVLRWTDPLAWRDGTPLSNFRIRIYRDSGLVTLVDSGRGMWTDTGLALHHLCRYTLVTVTALDTSSPVLTSVFAGGAASPALPSGFTAVDGKEGILLRWTNPVTQADGTVLNDFGGIDIYRDSVLIRTIGQLASDTGKGVAWADSVSGYHVYSINARDTEVPLNFSEPAPGSTGYGGVLDRINENFDPSHTDLMVSGGWDTITAAGRHAYTSSPSGPDPLNQTSWVMTPPVILGERAYLRFTQAAVLGFGSTGFVEVSSDQRKTFSILAVAYAGMHPGWQDGMLDEGDWYYKTLDLSSMAGDTVVIRFRLSTGAIAGEGWFVDDLQIGSFSGTAVMTVRRGWNMIAPPLRMTDYSADTLFPGAVSPAFAYSGTRYHAVNHLLPVSGCWVKFDSTVDLSFAGSMTPAETVSVVRGWNIVGSLSFPYAASQVKSVPTGLVASPFTVFDSVYRTAGIIRPGEAAWVKVSGDGELVLTAQPEEQSMEKLSTRASQETAEIIFEDTLGRTTSLYILPTEAGISATECPPLPPEGCFDIRFANQNRSITAGFREGCRILMQSVTAPVTVRWKQIPPGTILVLDQSEVHLNRTGICRIGSLPEQIFIRTGTPAEVMPKEFALGQNFPNPFNPRTEIGYDLPARSRVHLAVYDLLGRVVEILFDGIEDAGHHRATWDASAVAGGVYFYQLEETVIGEPSRTFTDVKKMILIK